MYLGIDIGTSAVKLLLVDNAGAIIASASSPLDVSRPHTGWSEQDPDWWWQAVDAAALELRANYPDNMADIQSIGLSGQMHGMVALDNNHAVLRPAILWNDTRCADEAAKLDAEVPAFREIGGNAVMPGFTAPKAVWMAEHEPELFAQIDTILLPKDYVRLLLTGEAVSDMSDAAGTLWLDVSGRCWSEALLAASGLNIAQMPRLVEGSDVSGKLYPDIAKRWGIAGQPIVAGGGGDNAAAAMGLGVIRPGDGFLSLGTSGVVFMVTNTFAPAAESGAHAFCHALHDRWHQMGVILAASDCVSWLCTCTGLEVSDLMAEMEKTDLSQTMPIFHPYLSGERTPHNNANARGGFFGLSRNHGPGDMARAVLQGVAFAIADAMDVLRAAGGAPDYLLATGGGANNASWLRMIASVTGCDIQLPSGADNGAALGAARLAMLADGHLIEQVCQKPVIAETITPDAKLGEVLRSARDHSQKIYRLLDTGL